MRLEPSTVDNTIAEDGQESHQAVAASAADQGVDARLKALAACRPRQTLAEFLRIATKRYPKDRIGDEAGALAALQRCIDAGHKRGPIANALSDSAYAAMFEGADVPLLSEALLSMIDARVAVRSPIADQSNKHGTQTCLGGGGTWEAGAC